MISGYSVMNKTFTIIVEVFFKVYEDITETLNNKLAAMNVFNTQLGEFPDARSLGAIEALAKYRGSTVSVLAAEAFSLIREIK